MKINWIDIFYMGCEITLYGLLAFEIASLNGPKIWHAKNLLLHNLGVYRISY